MFSFKNLHKCINCKHYIIGNPFDLSTTISTPINCRKYQKLEQQPEKEKSRPCFEEFFERNHNECV